MTLSKDEIVSFAEACGWTDATMTNGEFRGIEPGCHCRIWTRVDFANDLAGCFEALEWFSSKHELAWQVTKSLPTELLSCSLISGHQYVASHHGDTVQAAIIRAVNAAARRKHG